jgi:hypothetical protein
MTLREIEKTCLKIIDIHLVKKWKSTWLYNRKLKVFSYMSFEQIQVDCQNNYKLLQKRQSFLFKHGSSCLKIYKTERIILRKIIKYMTVIILHDSIYDSMKPSWVVKGTHWFSKVIREKTTSLICAEY